jgi:hypothetical protein
MVTELRVIGQWILSGSETWGSMYTLHRRNTYTHKNGKEFLWINNKKQ